MKPFAKIALHLAVGIAAFLLVPVVSRHEPDSVAGETDVRSGRPAEKSTASRDVAVTPGMKSADYQAAWDAIPAMGWDKEKRIEWQIRLLKEWAAVDLEGALAAAFAETRTRNGYRVIGETFVFHRAFNDVFVDRSEDVMKLIESRGLGILESSLLLEAWTTTLLARDKNLYLTYLNSLAGDDFHKAVSSAAFEADKETLGKLLDAISAKHAAGLSIEGMDRQLAGVAKTFSEHELIERLRASSGEMAGFYTKLLATNYAGAAKTATSEQVDARIDSLPEEQRGPFARALLTANSGNAELLQTALEHLVDHEQWQLLDRAETSRAVVAMREKANPVVLAEWALSLPRRQETNEMFHRGVEPFIRKSPEEAWSWIQEMEDDYWRDRALAEYSQINLHVFNDPEKSATALGQIRDPEFLKVAQGWRKGWEARQGK
jgi:hypothetical protein